MTPRRRWSLRRRVAAGIAVVALGAGAGAGAVARAQGSDDSEADARPPDYYASSATVCTLLSAAELRVVLARRFAEGIDPGITNTFVDMPGLTKCRYPSAEKEGTPHIEIGVVYAYAGQIFDDVRKLRARRDEVARSRGAGNAPVPVRGLGDRAVWFPAAHELLVLDGDKIFAVAVPAEVLEWDNEVRERARRLAAKALERL